MPVLAGGVAGKLRAQWLSQHAEHGRSMKDPEIFGPIRGRGATLFLHQPQAPHGDQVPLMRLRFLLCLENKRALAPIFVALP